MFAPLSQVGIRLLPVFCAAVALAANMVWAQGQTNQRHEIPSQEQQKRSRAEIKSLFQDQYRDQSRAGLATLAKTLLDTGRESSDQPIDQFTLFRESVDVSVALGDLTKALETCELIAESFQFDLEKARYQVVKQVARNLFDEKSVNQFFSLTLELIADCVADDRYRHGQQYMQVLQSTSRKGQLKQWNERLKQESKQLDQTARAFKSIARQLAEVRKGGGSQDANQAVGEFYCFRKGQWDTGLPYLAKGSDVKLSKLAQQELGRPENISQWLQIADRWWDLDHPQSKLHAREIYAQQRERATGLTRTRIEARLEKMNSSERGELRFSAKGEIRGEILWSDATGKSWKNTIVLRRDGSYSRTAGNSRNDGTWNIRGNEIMATSKNRPGVVDRYLLTEDGKFTVKTWKNSELKAEGRGTFGN